MFIMSKMTYMDEETLGCKLSKLHKSVTYKMLSIQDTKSLVWSKLLIDVTLQLRTLFIDQEGTCLLNYYNF